MEWVEAYVARLRSRLEIAGPPTEADLCRCVDLFPRVRVRSGQVQTAFCAHGENGGALIVLPRGLRGRRWERALTHELGHAVLTCGMYHLLLQLAPDEPRIGRLARAWRRKEERIARAFESAWLDR